MNKPDREEAMKMARELFSEQHFPDSTRNKVADTLLDFAVREAERAAAEAQAEGDLMWLCNHFTERAAYLRSQKS